MIKLFIFSLLAIVLALLVNLYLDFPADPGYLLIAFGSYTFETSLFALFVGLLLIYILVKLLMLLIDWINPWQLVRYGRRLSRNRKASARSKSTEGLLYFIRKNWQSSYSLLSKSSKDPDATVINHLAAAYSAFEMDGKEDWVQWLDKAEVEYPMARSTINSLRAQLYFKSGQLEQCLAVLEQLKKNSLNDATLLSLLKDVYIKLEEWQKLEQLLPTLEKLKIVEEQEIERIRKRIFMEQLYSAFNEDATDLSRDATVISLSKIWKKASARFKEDEKVVNHYTDLLSRLDAKAEACKALELALNKNWSDDLILSYGGEDFGLSPQQLIQAETWLKARPGNASLLLSLGRICLRNELWGKAKEYYQASIKIEPTAEACGELSRLLKHLGDFEASEEYFKNYDDLIGVSLTNLPMPADSKLSH